MMIIIAVLGVILGILIPNIANVKNRAFDEEIVADIDAIALALENYREICKTYPSGWTTATNNIQYGSSDRRCSVYLGNIIPTSLKKIKDPFAAGVSYNGVSRSGAVGNCIGYRIAYPLSSSKAIPIQRQNNQALKSSSTYVDCSSGNSLPALSTNYYIKFYTGL